MGSAPIAVVYFVLISSFVSSDEVVSEQQGEKFKDARLFTVKSLEDPDTQTTDQWKEVKTKGYSRIRATPEKCKAFIQGLTDAETGQLMWDEHRCTVLTLVYKCHAKVRLLERGGRHVLAEGEDKKELFLEILVDDGHKRVVPLSGVASRELAMLLVMHQQQEGLREHPDFHVKKEKFLGPDFFGQEPPENPYGFNDCVY